LGGGVQIFFADGCSIAVEVAMKMAIQYQYGKSETQRHNFATIRSGYHGDTWHAMSECDPVTCMSRLFAKILPVQYFLPQPQTPFGQPWNEDDIKPLADLLEKKARN